MLKEIEYFINDKNNFEKYIEMGYKFIYDFNDSKLIIIYNKEKYELVIVQNEEQFYWHLSPYNKSFFETNINNDLDMVLFAIKENDETYNI